MSTYKKPTKKQCGPPLWQNFPCDGIWLVQSKPNRKSSACIMKIDDLPSLYPFAQMAVSADDICTFLGDFDKRAQEKTGVYKEIRPGVKTLVSWTSPSRQDTAMAILMWLSQQVGGQSGGNCGSKLPSKDTFPVDSLGHDIRSREDF